MLKRLLAIEQIVASARARGWRLLLGGCWVAALLPRRLYGATSRLLRSLIDDLCLGVLIAGAANDICAICSRMHNPYFIFGLISLLARRRDVRPAPANISWRNERQIT